MLSLRQLFVAILFGTISAVVLAEGADVVAEANPDAAISAGSFLAGEMLDVKPVDIAVDRQIFTADANGKTCSVVMRRETAESGVVVWRASKFECFHAKH